MPLFVPLAPWSAGGGDREDVALSYSKLDAERSRELLGLQYDVPWSVWGGQWASSTDTLTGMLVKYRQRKFLLKFPHANNTEPVWLTWGQVLGEQALCGAVFLRPHETVTAPVIDGTTHRDFKKRGVVRYPSPTLGRLPLPISLRSLSMPPRVHSRRSLYINVFSFLRLGSPAPSYVLPRTG